jgi:hypothetical protein
MASETRADGENFIAGAELEARTQGRFADRLNAVWAAVAPRPVLERIILGRLECDFCRYALEWHLLEPLHGTIIAKERGRR